MWSVGPPFQWELAVSVLKKFLLSSNYFWITQVKNMLGDFEIKLSYFLFRNVFVLFISLVNLSLIKI
jgi:hypothetical protein